MDPNCSKSEKPTANDLKNVIDSVTEPVVFKNLLEWDILSWNLKDWKDRLGNEELQFRWGHNKHTEKPQWENTTSTVKGTFQYFLEYQNTYPNNWLYFDYKYLKEWLSDIPEIVNSISWKEFGFPNLNHEDSTIWIGSKWAHTPCHIDTYGCNLIAQIYGTKEWFICPPEENLLPTRIPYEESSIYSKLNLFSPDSRKFPGINNARLVTLHPGEVLFLPHGWWHYVENKELAISVNVWIPHSLDDENRVEEALVQFLTTQFVTNMNSADKSSILNPSNQNDELSTISINDGANLISKCMETLNTKKVAKKCKFKNHIKNEELHIEKDLQKFSSYMAAVPKLSHDDLQLWLKSQVKQVEAEMKTIEKESDNVLMEVIDKILQPDVIELIKNKLLRHLFVFISLIII